MDRREFLKSTLFAAVPSIPFLALKPEVKFKKSDPSGKDVISLFDTGTDKVFKYFVGYSYFFAETNLDIDLKGKPVSLILDTAPTSCIDGEIFSCKDKMLLCRTTRKITSNDRYLLMLNLDGKMHKLKLEMWYG